MPIHAIDVQISTRSLVVAFVKVVGNINIIYVAFSSRKYDHVIIFLIIIIYNYTTSLYCSTSTLVFLCLSIRVSVDLT